MTEFPPLLDNFKLISSFYFYFIPTHQNPQIKSLCLCLSLDQSLERSGIQAPNLRSSFYSDFILCKLFLSPFFLLLSCWMDLIKKKIKHLYPMFYFSGFDAWLGSSLVHMNEFFHPILQDLVLFLSEILIQCVAIEAEFSTFALLGFLLMHPTVPHWVFEYVVSLCA